MVDLVTYAAVSSAAFTDWPRAADPLQTPHLAAPNPKPSETHDPEQEEGPGRRRAELQAVTQMS